MIDPNGDLADIRQKWLRFCSHDIPGLPLPCICPTEDHRPVIAALVGEVETLRAEVARLTAERDEARNERDLWQAEHATARDVIAAVKVQRDSMRPVVEAAKAWREEVAKAERRGVPPVTTTEVALAAAVDQMAPPASLVPSVTAQDVEVVPKSGSEADSGVATLRGPDGQTLEGTYRRDGKTVTSTFRGSEVDRELRPDEFRMSGSFEVAVTDAVEAPGRPDADRLCRVCAHPLGKGPHDHA